MSEALLEPRGRTDDRLLLTIVIAAAVHAMVVLGVRFTPDAPLKSRFATMEVLLVPVPAPAASTAYPLQLEAATSGEPPLLPMPPVEPPVIKAATTPAPALAKAAPVRPEPATTSTPPAAAPPVSAATTEATPDTPASAAPPLPTAAQLIERSLAIAATGAGLIEEKTVSGQSRSERTLYIKRNTRDFSQAVYVDALLRKTKDFGQLFQRDVPAGRVEVDVAIATDGSLAGATVTRSSGIEATDAEALRILEQAAPFAPLPPDMAKKFDVAHIEFTINLTKDEGL